jgi:hypothetical protein
LPLQIVRIAAVKCLDNKKDRMASSNIAPKSGESPPANHAELLETDARVLAYLRAAMLESGDDPRAIAVAISNVEAARAKLRRKGPLQVTSDVMELSRLVAKQLA